LYCFRRAFSLRACKKKQGTVTVHLPKEELFILTRQGAKRLKRAEQRPFINCKAKVLTEAFITKNKNLKFHVKSMQITCIIR
jgi:hypothetical protein